MTNPRAVSLRELIMISRPRWWIFTAQPFLVTYLLLAEQFDITALIGTLFLLFPYNLLMYGINDIYDYESDIRNPRKTDVMAKSKHRSLAINMTVLSAPFIIYLLLVGTTASRAWFIVMIFMVFAYSHQLLRWKEVPFLDSITSSFHYTSPVMLALLLTQNHSAFLPAFVAYFLWAMGNHAFGAIQDIKPDKAAGISSVATALGARATAWFVLALYVSASSLAVVYYGLLGLIAALLITINIAGTVVCLRRATSSEHMIYRRTWIIFTYTNYLAGGVMTISILAAYV